MKILVIGDAMWDYYAEGTIDRLNPEDHTVPLIQMEGEQGIRWQHYPGGAANVAENIRGLGVEAHLVSGAGRQEKYRILVGDRVVYRFDSGRHLEPIVHLPDPGGFDGVVISDYGKGSINRENRKEICAKYAGRPMFLDTKGSPEVWLGYRTDLTAFPNYDEYCKYRRDYNTASCCLVTLGSAGAQLKRDGATVAIVPPVPTAVKNVAGAGDTVVAAFTAHFLSNRNSRPQTAILDAARFSMLAASIAVSRSTTYAPRLVDFKGTEFESAMGA